MNTKKESEKAMGKLTNDMTILSDKIVTLREASQNFIIGLQSNVSAMQADFCKHRGEAAEKSQADLTEFTTDLKSFRADLKSNVSDIRDGFWDDHINMGNEIKAKLADYVSSLKQSVKDLRQEFADDLGGARQAWLDTSRLGPSRFEAGVAGPEEKEKSEPRHHVKVKETKKSSSRGLSKRAKK